MGTNTALRKNGFPIIQLGLFPSKKNEEEKVAYTRPENVHP